MPDKKSILIIGGTGTLGVALLNELTKFDHNITVLSRDEQKHYRLKKIYPNVNFVIGDIKDIGSINPHFKGVDSVFHVAALKHIDILENHIEESIKTNIIGTLNAIKCAQLNQVKNFMFSSTDKAVDPINVYGHCKAISEKLVLNANKESNTNFTVFRWGNIINSNGSALPFFIDKIKKGEEIPLTHINMSRFFLTIENAVGFILSKYEEPSNEVYVHPEMKAARIFDVIKVIAKMLDKPYSIKLVGLRPGEKIDECLYSKYSGRFLDSKVCDQYTESELEELIRPML